MSYGSGSPRFSSMLTMRVACMQYVGRMQKGKGWWMRLTLHARVCVCVCVIYGMLSPVEACKTVRLLQRRFSHRQCAFCFAALV
ncbi:hypothetical protein M440DRAFT_281136 [Trichoderma longibrachiatum ATCC 18648]|uniref:Uncharacterized protein n=1 Tax=Trichoderma longibrachiatum ATCC 18648 TaxID=983965 RepID=A0A2T4C7E6_TRILO|nr:hypothetical protein M440DRAFT_281136 [Trichoderma longibrachiatum ATCC 18648]